MQNSRFLRIGIVIILIPGMLGMFLHPTKTNADVGGVAKCTTAGLIGSGASYLVGLGLAALLGTVPVNDSQNSAKEYVADVLARCLARQVLDGSIGRMLEIVRRGGRDGGASYVKNWRNFQTNAQYRGEAVFRGILANTQTCDYLQQDINKTFRVSARDKISLKGQNIRVDSQDPFTVRGRCTMPSNFDMEKYKQDFSGNGGWGAFLRMLEPQNNYYGLVLQSSGEADKQKALEVSSDVQEAQAGRGYLSLRGKGSGACLTQGPNGRCIFYSDVKSPGAYVADTVAAQIQQELAWITNADELNEVVATLITERLVARLLDLGADEKAPTYGADPTPPPGILPQPPICPDPDNPECGGGGGNCAEEITTPGQSGPFGGDIKAAIDEVRSTTTGILSGDSQPYQIDPSKIAPYFDEMKRILRGKGYIVVPDYINEIGIYKLGAGTAEQYAIRTSGNLTRAAWKGTGCPLPQ